jgi:hypothetical protein
MTGELYRDAVDLERRAGGLRANLQTWVIVAI